MLLSLSGSDRREAERAAPAVLVVSPCELAVGGVLGGGGLVVE